MRRQLGKDSGKTNVHSEDRVPGLEGVDVENARDEEAFRCTRRYPGLGTQAAPLKARNI